MFFATALRVESKISGLQRIKIQRDVARINATQMEIQYSFIEDRGILHASVWSSDFPANRHLACPALWRKPIRQSPLRNHHPEPRYNYETRNHSEGSAALHTLKSKYNSTLSMKNIFHIEVFLALPPV